MSTKPFWPKVMALGGTLMVLAPLAFTLLLGIIHLLSSKFLMFDYLLPAELYPLVFIGGLMLIAVAFWQKLERKLIGVSLGVATLALLLVIAIGLAGLEPKAGQPVSFQMIIIYLLLTVYTGALVALGWGGFKLFRQLSTRGQGNPGFE